MCNSLYTNKWVLSSYMNITCHRDLTWLTRQVTLVDQELLNLTDHQSSCAVFSLIRIVQSIVFCGPLFVFSLFWGYRICTGPKGIWSSTTCLSDCIIRRRIKHNKRLKILNCVIRSRDKSWMKKIMTAQCEHHKKSGVNSGAIDGYFVHVDTIKIQQHRRTSQ